MKKREAWNLIYHVLGGGALTALVCWNLWFMVLATFIYAFLREQAQHRWMIGDSFTFQDGSKMFEIEKRTFSDFGWLGWQQVFEILQWTFGSTVVCTIHHFTV